MKASSEAKNTIDKLKQALNEKKAKLQEEIQNMN